MFSKLLLIVAIVYPSIVLAQSPYSTDESFRPSEGIWWSSEEPGTGVGFNMDSQGRWFAAIYLYDEDGRPSFLTMQGEALDYLSSDGQQFPATWAIAASPLILSEGGQCIACPWSQAATSDTGQDAEIRFYGRNRAELRVDDWALELTPLTVLRSGPFDAARPTFNRHYLFTGAVEPGGLQHVAVVRVNYLGGFPGVHFTRIECIACRTVGADGAPDDAIDDALVAAIEAMRVVCGPGACRFHTDDAHSSDMFVDKNGQIFSTIDTRPAPAGSPSNVIKLQLLDEGWRP